MTTVKMHPVLPEAEYEDFLTLAEASADKESALTGVWNAILDAHFQPGTEDGSISISPDFRKQGGITYSDLVVTRNTYTKDPTDPLGLNLALKIQDFLIYQGDKNEGYDAWMTLEILIQYADAMLAPATETYLVVAHGVLCYFWKCMKDAQGVCRVAGMEYMNGQVDFKEDPNQAAGQGKRPFPFPLSIAIDGVHIKTLLNYIWKPPVPVVQT